MPPAGEVGLPFAGLDVGEEDRPIGEFGAYIDSPQCFVLVRPAVGNGGLRRRHTKGQGVASGRALVQDAEGLAQEFSEGHFFQGQGDAPFGQGAQTEVRHVAEGLGGRPSVAAFSMKPHGDFFRCQERRGH